MPMSHTRGHNQTRPRSAPHLPLQFLHFKNFYAVFVHFGAFKLLYLRERDFPAPSPPPRPLHLEGFLLAHPQTAYTPLRNYFGLETFLGRWGLWLGGGGVLLVLRVFFKRWSKSPNIITAAKQMRARPLTNKHRVLGSPRSQRKPARTEPPRPPLQRRWGSAQIYLLATYGK